MKKFFIIVMMFMISVQGISFATNDIDNQINYIENEYNINDDYTNTYEYENDHLYNDFDEYTNSYYGDDGSVEPLSLSGKIIEASEVYTYDNGYVKYLAQTVKVEITDSKHKGEIYEIIYSLEDEYNVKLPLYPELKVNDKVFVYANFENGKLYGEASIQHYDKSDWLIIVVIIYAALIVVIGGKKGLKALVGLIVTIALIFFVLVPGLLAKYDPVWLTVLVCSIIIFITFIIISGFSKKTIAAICGTIAGVVAAGLLGSIFSNAMKLDGVNDDARQLSVFVTEKQEMYNFEGIMLAGIMISALGACMDVGMSIASSISELKTENPDMTTSKLIKSGMNIGRDVMGTMTNTLILAYVGSTMITIMLYTINEFSLADILNRENVTMDVLNSLVGSIGLVCTIPLTAIVSGLIMGSDFEKRKKHKRKDDDEIKVRYFNG